MKRKLNLTLLLSGLLAVLLIGCTPAESNTGEEADASTLPPVIETTSVVSAEAFVVPVREVDVAFESGGRVVELLAEEGGQIETQQLLARLNDADANAAVMAAQANLTQAQANLAQVQAGPTQEQVEVARAAVTQAEAALAQAVAGPTAQEIAVAEARVNTLRAQVNQAQAGGREENVQASLARLRQAEVALQQAQTDYDKIAYAADSELAQPIARALQNATLNYEAVKAEHEAVVNGATQQEVNIVRAQLAEGIAALEQLKAGPSSEQIAVAQAAVTQAEAALEQVKAGSTPEQIAVAQAGVEQAQAALEQAQIALDRLNLVAPFAGTLAGMDLDIGEIVTVGAPVATIADLSTWQVETDDLTEIDVVKVQIGQPVEVKFDALPEEAFNGVVSSIKPRSETKAGDVTYTVVINLENSNDARLRWGMTAFVEIDVE
jgi:HlyD family secretion protein